MTKKPWGYRDLVHKAPPGGGRMERCITGDRNRGLTGTSGLDPGGPSVELQPLLSSLHTAVPLDPSHPPPLKMEVFLLGLLT